MKCVVRCPKCKTVTRIVRQTIFVGDVLNKPFRCSICGKVVKPVEEIRGWD